MTISYFKFRFPSSSGYLFITALLTLSSCSSEKQGYFPLTEGHWWEYQETLTIRDESQSLRRIVTNISPIEYEGKDYFVQQTQGAGRHYFSLRENGIFQEDLEAKDAELLIPLNYSEKSSWQRASRLGVIESRTFAPLDRILSKPQPLILDYSIVSVDAEVNVPAGRFKHCLQIVARGSKEVRVDRRNAKAIVNVEHTDWYAQGVGLIKSERTEKSESSFLKTGHYSLELLKHQ